MATSKKPTAKKQAGDDQKVSPTRAYGPYTKWTQAKADELCAELAVGKSLKTVCEMKGMPSAMSVFRWMREHPGFAEQYDKAKQEAADAMAEDILDISDDVFPDQQAIAKAKLRVDTRKFLMAKMKPKRYGDKLDLTSDGKALPTPIYGGQSGDSTPRK